MEAALSFVDVVKCFGQGATEVQALRGVSFDVGQGELVALMGPSGCGKSTVLHVAGGMEDATAGRVLVAGTDLATTSRSARADLRRRDVGYVFQRLNLIPSLTAVENVMLPLELDGERLGQARRLALDALGRVGLSRRLDRFPDDFSGGEQQRIAIARAIVRRRSVVLADEPTGALDTTTGDEVIELLAELPRAEGTAVLLVTHEPRFARWADCVVFLRDGLVVDEASPELAPATTALP
jgi:putative ABC transport system ATP-binding protein